MPSSITHGYFAVDAYKKIKNKKNIDFNRLKSFSQGPDILFFYRSFNPIKGKKIRELGKYMQKNETQSFFYNTIKYIKDNNLENNKDVITFLYGFILHYSLDSIVHPYVFYKTGVYNPKKKETHKYKYLHEEIERYLDIYMIKERENKKINKFKFHKFLFDTKKFDEKLKNTIDYSFKLTYDVNNISKYYYIGLRIMSLSYYVLRYDPYRIKRYLYKIIMKVFPIFKINLEMLSYSNISKSNEHYLNKEKKIWNHPCIKEETFNYSFKELYEIALNEAIYLIEETDKILYGSKKISYSKEIFKNISYVTGKNCNLKIYNKYFEN